MVTLVCVAVVLVGMALALPDAVAWLVSARDRFGRWLVVARLHEADRKVAADHAKARRAMNDAAGQSWRNPFE